MSNQEIIFKFQDGRKKFYEDIEAAIKGLSFKEWMIATNIWTEEQYNSYYQVYLKFGTL